MNAVNQFNEQRQEREDEFDLFGKYIASEIRSLSDPNAARRVRFRMVRCLMDSIDAELQSNDPLKQEYSS